MELGSAQDGARKCSRWSEEVLEMVLGSARDGARKCSRWCYHHSAANVQNKFTGALQQGVVDISFYARLDCGSKIPLSFKTQR